MSPTFRPQQELAQARERLLALISDLTDDQLIGPKLSIVNPPLWEIGHLAWFQERWCLRYAGEGEPLRESILHGADALYDSSKVAHDTRWDLPLPDLDATLGYMRRVLDSVQGRLATRDDSHMQYFAQLCALHEEMHCEALSYTRQTHGYAAPAAAVQCPAAADIARGDVEIAGGEFLLGAPDEGRFVFDNEKWAHPVRVAPFAIARTCVTNAEFEAFVEDAGYERRTFWSEAGWNWRTRAGASHPVYWRKEGGSWHHRRFDRWLALESDAPVLHVNWFEAEAYCRWAGRRLPTEAEWELAASTTRKRAYPWGNGAPDATKANLHGVAGGPCDVAAFPQGDSAEGCRQMIGNVWEWCASDFVAYPGFRADPYKEYSEPWFGTHKVLRGGCFETRASLIRNTWRNFYTPDRRDVYAGFRTCAE